MADNIQPMFPGVSALLAYLREVQPEMLERVAGMPAGEALKMLAEHYRVDFNKTDSCDSVAARTLDAAREWRQ